MLGIIFKNFHDGICSRDRFKRQLLPDVKPNGYYVAYKPITLLCISFMFIEIKFMYSYLCMMFTMKSIKICNDYVN